MMNSSENKMLQHSTSSDETRKLSRLPQYKAIQMSSSDLNIGNATHNYNSMVAKTKDKDIKLQMEAMDDNYFEDENNNTVYYIDNNNNEELIVDYVHSQRPQFVPQGQKNIQQLPDMNNNMKTTVNKHENVILKPNAVQNTIIEPNTFSEKYIDANNNETVHGSIGNSIEQQNILEIDNSTNYNKTSDIYTFNDIYNPNKCPYNELNSSSKPLIVSRDCITSNENLAQHKISHNNNFKENILSNPINICHKRQINSVQESSKIFTNNTLYSKNGAMPCNVKKRILLPKKLVPKTKMIKTNLSEIYLESDEPTLKKPCIEKIYATDNKKNPHQHETLLASEPGLSQTDTDESDQTDSVYEDNLWDGCRYRFEGDKETFKWKVPPFKPTPQFNKDAVYDEG